MARSGELLAARAAALFTSDLSVLREHTRIEVAAAVRHAIGTHHGIGGCTAEVAAAYGEHPETAAHRMRWALTTGPPREAVMTITKELTPDTRSADRPSTLAPAFLASAEAYGTPLYVTDLQTLDRQAAEVESAFPDPWLRQYSLKANGLPALVRKLARRGWGGNVVSAGEWRLATRTGLPNAAITFEGIGKTDQELARVVRAALDGQPLRWLSVESADELHALAGPGSGTASMAGVVVRHQGRLQLDYSRIGYSLGGVVHLRYRQAKPVP